MPSDARTPQALEALSKPIAVFRSALSNTSEQARVLLEARVESEDEGRETAGAELGLFAAGRIDPERFAKLGAFHESLDAVAADAIRKALDTLKDLSARKENLFRVIVEPGSDLRDAVGSRLFELGRAFGAAHVVELAARGLYRESEHAALLEGYPFGRWSLVQRAVAPGLVVRVEGGDLRAAGLADFLDGSLKLVLVVQGEAPPAALVRLISPGIYVMQTAEASDLAHFVDFDGPGAAALVSTSAARFRHDPAGGPRLADRMTAVELPEGAPKAIRGLSSFQQAEDLRQLGALKALAEAALSVVEPAAAQPTPGAAADPAAKLSAWLLGQTDLSGLQ
jgi:hypothetical protein